jgi:L,D-peptidoglycan transpeptidase YkuD (ErfK/YbiS/YcfS/YnhG family)
MTAAINRHISLVHRAAVFLIPLFIGLAHAVRSQTDGLPADPTAGSTQAVVVRIPTWQSTTGTLQLYDRPMSGLPWVPVTRGVSVILGRTGVAWGSGLHGDSILPGPVKHEGDGKAPAGIFPLTAVFGYAPAESVAFLSMPYVEATKTCRCVDDPRSAYYNLILDSARVADADWSSAERMRLNGIDYRWGVIVGQNSTPRTPGRGSCIFLHIWESPSAVTTGCTAMDAGEAESLVRWLRSERKPLLIQLPDAEYTSLRERWRLP